MSGPLVLTGGAELQPGNEPQDRLLVGAAAGRPAYVIATAAHDAPDRAVANAQRWFATLGLTVEELRLRTATEARHQSTVAKASEAGFFYIVGGDPGAVVRVLLGSPSWEAIASAWRGGAALGGSSAGAMGLAAWVLLRASWPDRRRRRYQQALGLVPRTAVLPHYDTFGRGWLPSALEAMPDPAVVLLGADERTAAVHTDEAGWQALGAGSVTVVWDGQSRGFAAGEPISGVPAPV
ncbi:MAG: Type 1 glutamine amidotransferase-like domain-containing protein [Candidatus Dormibacteria bacterium]